MKLDTNKIYYLAAPLTSCGDITKNYENEQGYYATLRAIKTKAGLIRPLSALPDARVCDMDWAEAMQKCRALLSVADGIILCPGWERSKGCKEERAYAEHMGMEIVEYEELFA